MTDLFTTSPDDWADEIYIVAPGSTADVGLIPDGAKTLCLNAAIDLVDNPFIWMVSDNTFLDKYDWAGNRKYAYWWIMSEVAANNMIRPPTRVALIA